jgi:dihydrofolate reductase
MRNIILLLNVTPDGYCDHRSVIADEELHLYANELVKRSDTMLFGRNTYQLFESYWPQVAEKGGATPAENEFAHLVNDVHKVVVSTTLQQAGWKNTTLVKDNVAVAIAALKQQPGKDIVMPGSPGLAASLAQWEMIDEYRFLVQPMLAGHGKRLFSTDVFTVNRPLVLVHYKHFDSGVVALSYRPETAAMKD